MQTIDIYSRKQAIRDGMLIEIPMNLVKEAGINYPVAVTSKLFHEWIVPTEADRRCGQSEEGRIWDILSWFRFYSKKVNGDTLFFYCCFMKNKRQHDVMLKAIIHPGDDLSPVITIMLAEEK